jgi:hypothetical protein
MADSDNLWADYRETLASFRQLADIRFKLLAVLPPVSTAAVGLISFDLAAFRQAPAPRLVVALLGLAVTLGLVFYDVRNSQLYAGLATRAKALESRLGLPLDGQFLRRPARSLHFLGFIKIWHDRGLALIYGSVLGGWLFPLLCGLLWLIDADRWLPRSVPSVGGALAVMGACLMIWELHRLDRSSSEADAV